MRKIKSLLMVLALMVSAVLSSCGERQAKEVSIVEADTMIAGNPAKLISEL